MYWINGFTPSFMTVDHSPLPAMIERENYLSTEMCVDIPEGRCLNRTLLRNNINGTIYLIFDL